MAPPEIIAINEEGIGSTGFVKSRFAQHDQLYGRVIKETIAEALNSNLAYTVPSTKAFTSLEDQKVDRAGDTMTGNLVLDDADLIVRDVIVNGEIQAPKVDVSGNLEVGNTTTTKTLDVTQNSDLRGNVVVHKNLTVLGSTTTVQSNVVTIDDPVIQVGSHSTVDTVLDRGITFLYHNESENEKTGFFGWDRALNAFVMRPDADEQPENLIGGKVGDMHAYEFKGNLLTISNTANIEGATTLGNSLSVDGVATFHDDVSIVNADLDANSVVSLSASGKATTVRGTLSVMENATFDANVTIDGPTLVDDAFENTGITKLASAGVTTTVRGPLTVNESTTLSGNVTVNNATQINAPLTVIGEVTLADEGVQTTVLGPLDVDQKTTFHANVLANEHAKIDKTLTVLGATQLASSGLLTTVKGGFQVNQDSTLTGNVTVGGETQVNNTLTATGKTTLASPGIATDVLGTLDVAEASTFGANVEMGGNLKVDEALTVDGETKLAVSGVDTTVRGPLIANEASTLTGNVTVGGATQVNNTLTATGKTTLASPGIATDVLGTLDVAEASTFSANVTMEANVKVDEALTVDGETKLAVSGVDTTVRGPLIANETSTLTGNVTVGGATQVNNTLTATGKTTLASPGIATDVLGTLDVAEASTFSANVTMEEHAQIDETLTVSGATSLGSTLDVTGNVTVSAPSVLKFGSSHRKHLHLFGTTYGVGTQANGLFFQSPTGFKWYRGGYTGSGTEAMILDASGNLTVEKNITSLSDARIKTNVQTLENVSEKLEQVRGVRYERVDQPESGTEIGVIAQEMETVFPEVVLTDKNTGMKSVAYANLVGALIQAHKETRAELRALRRMVEELQVAKA